MNTFNLICTILALLIEVNYFCGKTIRAKTHRVFPAWQSKVVIALGVVCPIVNLIAGM